MPCLEGQTIASGQTFVLTVDHRWVLVLDTHDQKQADAIDVVGQPVLVMTRPDGRQIWIGFTYLDSSEVQIIDSKTHEVIETLCPNPGMLHMEFSGRGGQVQILVCGTDQLRVWNPYRLRRVGSLPARSPSGILFSHHAQHIEPWEAPWTTSPAASPPAIRGTCRSTRNPTDEWPRPQIAAKPRCSDSYVAWKPTACYRGLTRCPVTNTPGPVPWLPQWCPKGVCDKSLNALASMPRPTTAANVNTATACGSCPSPMTARNLAGYWRRSLPTPTYNPSIYRCRKPTASALRFP